MTKPDWQAVLATLTEFNEIGRRAFLQKYGFADQNITYEIEHEGSRYPSKAIFGAAFGKMPGENPKDSGSCNGTEARIHLAKTGFNIVSGSAPEPQLDSGALALLHDRYLSLHPDFKTFDDCPSFASGEGGYKRALVTRAAELLARNNDNTALGGALLDLATNKGGLFSNLIDWRASAMVDEVRASHPNLVEEALGAMARTRDEPAAAVIACVDTLWPAFIAGRSSKPYAESRMVPTMIMALLEPDAILGIRSTPTKNAYRMLTSKTLFAWDRLTRNELDASLTMAKNLHRIMRDDWRWAPRDLWDVQSFIWETCQKPISDAAPENATDPASDTPMPLPTNMILYGPPGTGKTYATATEAVLLCDGADYPDTDQGRVDLMAHYRRLEQEGRIRFTTFHQSYAYEDFIEGLRPPTQGNAQRDEDSPSEGGLRLTVHDGLFKQIANAARLDQSGAAPARRFDRERRVFKVALGRRQVEENLIREALDAQDIRLGWGGDIDWSGERFESFYEILEEWRRHEPDATGKNANVEMIFSFRATMVPGDYVLISDGRDRIRAIGCVNGDYRHVPNGARHPHRRAVQWLWRNDDGIDRDALYPNMFRQHSIYELREELLDWDAMDALAFGTGKASSTDARPYVLVIDEINRGNISKIFGELITLIEGDKRLGSKNAIEAILPYSQKPFGVPANLHIIGTMNTADRSIALLDTALRRRFTFRELPPRPELLGPVEGIDVGGALSIINERIEYLIDREHRIGHAFFMGCASRIAMDAVMRDKVIPLLQEYFFEDWGRIAAVLGLGFIGRRKLPPPPGMGNLPVRDSWFVRWDAALEAFPKDAYDRLLSRSEPESDETEAA